MSDETKKCPHCGEIIKSQAIFCRYCRRDLLVVVHPSPLPQKTQVLVQEPTPVSESISEPIKQIEKEVVGIKSNSDKFPIRDSFPQEDIALIIEPKKQSSNFIKIALIVALFVSVICILSCAFLVVLYFLDSGSSFSFISPTPQFSHYATMKPNNPESTSEPYNSSPSTSDTNTSWFTGGNLHKAKVSEWRNATYANRLATSADFIAATQDVDYGDMAGFKQMSTDLETCISTAVSGGDVDNEDVVFISSMCTVMLFPK